VNDLLGRSGGNSRRRETPGRQLQRQLWRHVGRFALLHPPSSHPRAASTGSSSPPQSVCATARAARASLSWQAGPTQSTRRPTVSSRRRFNRWTQCSRVWLTQGSPRKSSSISLLRTASGFRIMSTPYVSGLISQSVS
jgi:hypothetical protein